LKSGLFGRRGIGLPLASNDVMTEARYPAADMLAWENSVVSIDASARITLPQITIRS
jgi:hypothetical protein